jgi:hypothetical protein
MAMLTTNRFVTLFLSLSMGFVAPAMGAPVVYTLRTVADGRLGNHVFSQALITIRMESSTRTVKKSVGSNGGALYTNSGATTVSITDHGHTLNAKFAPGEVYVRYDAGAGIAGFGSSISPTYPVALGCDDYAYPDSSSYVTDCAQGNWGPNTPYGGSDDGIANALASNASGFYSDFSAALLSLPMTLAQSTLLTGGTHSCATVYTVGYDFSGSGDLGVCSAPASHGLRTDHGGLYLQDSVGGTGNPPNPFGTFWAGWSVANSGSLNVEVLPEEDD